ncbi:phage head-binding domain-containing protein [Citrobacter portucalensis]|uniref:phage head-binding domain-containing protein n=1 Tax=Citrobacter portucalensis TaxID=1639133 RepID=UPI002542C587|nr:phage head-binding domain-containing protein [Citrobacter portucalensis]MDT7479465.1 phage head-binding domain-containing protein [Citrobacter portucalensis]MDX7130306.1 phage head-binding domain-containing protein [Citrobacter portucalensis]WIJ58851.1 phage head-binding domain-containing protein [Citrobacter portucalensis]
MSDIIPNIVVSQPAQLFTLARSFKSNANGKVYIGKIDTDPVNPANQIQVYIDPEDGSDPTPVSQPIIINAAGYPVYNGQIAKFVTVEGHSMAIYDAYGSQQFYYPNVLKYDPDQLRQELAGDDGYLLIPSIPIPVWKSNGDVRGWGAKCDGITDDITAITNAISDTGGNIIIPGDVFVSTHILVKDKTNPVVEFTNGATVKIDTSFIFADKYRGIISIDNCINPKVVNPIIIGAKLDKFNGGVDPVEDGDSGIEYMNCTGLCHTINPNVIDVKAWGVIHINIEDYHVENPVMRNCQVQSGVGGTGVRTALVTNPIMDDIGLYGVEIETVNTNKLSSVIGGVIRNSRNAISIVNNSDNINVNGVIAINCLNGFSSERAPSDATTIPENVNFVNNNAISCKSSYSLIYVNNNTISECSSTRMDTEYFARTSSYDRVYKMSGSIAYCPTKEGATAPSVGSVIEFDNGVQKIIATVEPNITDQQFGTLYGFTCTVPLTADYLRRSFKRYVEVVTVKRGVVMYGGSGNAVKNATFKDDTDILVSYGDHDRIQWSNNYAKGAARYFTQGSAGTVSGSIHVDTHNCDNIGSWGDITKMCQALKTKRTYAFKGGTTHALTEQQNAIPITEGFIGKVRCSINSGQTTTGSIVLKINNTDAIIDSFTGTPLRGTSNLTTPIGVSGAAVVQLTDTVGDLIASGYAIELEGVFK